MLKGPHGERRLAGVIGCAGRVAKIATGEIVNIKGRTPGRCKSGEDGAPRRS